MAYKDPEVQRQRHHDYYIRNRPKIQAAQRAYREANKRSRAEWYSLSKEGIRAYGYAKRHGIRPEDWGALWDAQDGKCYLCGDELVEGKVHIDHNHDHCGQGKSCQVCRRGLTCRNCNNAIGMAADDPARLRRLADALEAANDAFLRRVAASGEQLLLGGH